MYRWVDHTAEVELEIEAASEREIFMFALQALAELLGFGDAQEQSAQRTVTARAADRPALLAGWLEELVYLAESEGFVATAMTDLSLEDDTVTGHVIGLLDDPPPLVKAVTLHRLLFDARPGGYLARVVLDV